MRSPLRQNFSALSTRLAIARSNSSMSSAATGAGAAAHRARPASRHPGSAARWPKRTAMSSSSSPASSRSQRRRNSGSSSCARSPSDCTRRAALWVLRSAIATSSRSCVARRVALPAPLQRLQAGGGGRQRRAQVVRQVADTFAAEMVEPAQAAHWRRTVSSIDANACVSLPNSSPLRAGSKASGRAGRAAFEPVAGDRCHRLRQLAQRPRHRGDDPGRQQRGQHDDAA